MIKVEKIDTFAGHRDCVYCILNSSFGVFSAGGDGQVIKWDLDKPDLGTLFIKTKRSIYSMVIDETQNKLYVAENFEGIYQIDLNTQKIIKSVKLSNAAIFDMKIYENNLIVAGGDGVITILEKDELFFKKHIKISEKSIRKIAINPLRNEFVSVSSDFSFKVFNLLNFELVAGFEGHQNSIFSVCFDQSYNYFVTGSRDAHLKIWDASDFSLIKDIPAHLFAVNAIAFQPKDDYFATCSMDKSIKIWDAKSFTLLKVLDKARYAGHGTSINTICWANETTLLAGSDDKLISVWKIEKL